MILNGGVHEGKRYLSEAVVRQMTSTQTGNLLNNGQNENGYGFGWSTTRRAHGERPPAVVGGCGHGGAYATDLWVDPQRGLITVFMVQHAGFPGPDGSKVRSAFNKAVADALAK